ncbi:imidazoleglycerol-phosphate dehydratase HisB [Candidatus Micrarchaeota archaeon]|nr:imidazoleglycerol-phosphate dehydratase HisB [Candidatus Micrarchaeota archaeon]
MIRKVKVERKTRETDISVELNLDGGGSVSSARTGLRFFDHMLESFGKHSKFDLRVQGKGDLEVDEHHLVEDVGICLGEAIAKALGGKKGVRRFGFALVPMDDALARVAVDLSGRSYLVYEVKLRGRKVGDVSGENFEHFFESFAKAAGVNVNAWVDGKNDHHKVEALFKALAVALRDAVRVEGKLLPTIKGKL